MARAQPANGALAPGNVSQAAITLQPAQQAGQLANRADITNRAPEERLVRHPRRVGVNVYRHAAHLNRLGQMVRAAPKAARAEAQS